MVERLLPKQNVAGSNPVSRSWPFGLSEGLLFYPDNPRGESFIPLSSWQMVVLLPDLISWWSFTIERRSCSLSAAEK